MFAPALVRQFSSIVSFASSFGRVLVRWFGPLRWFRSFVRFVRSLVRSFLRSFVTLFVWLVGTFVRSLARLFCSFVRQLQTDESFTWHALPAAGRAIVSTRSARACICSLHVYTFASSKDTLR